MGAEHPINQPIRTLCVWSSSSGEAHETYQVGIKGVTRIEATTKSGLHADMPYIRVWAGDAAIAEFCQHNVQGIYFERPKTGKLAP